MQCELSVALQLKVPHHFIERLANGRARRVEDPGAFGATPTPKTLLFNPYQFPTHGSLCRFAQRGLTACLELASRQRTKRSPFAAAYCLIAAEDRHPVWAWRKMRKGTGRVYMRQFGRSVGHPTYIEGFCSVRITRFGASCEVAQLLAYCFTFRASPSRSVLLSIRVVSSVVL